MVVQHVAQLIQHLDVERLLVHELAVNVRSLLSRDGGGWIIPAGEATEDDVRIYNRAMTADQLAASCAAVS